MSPSLTPTKVDAQETRKEEEEKKEKVAKSLSALPTTISTLVYYVFRCRMQIRLSSSTSPDALLWKCGRDWKLGGRRWQQQQHPLSLSRLTAAINSEGNRRRLKSSAAVACAVSDVHFSQLTFHQLSSLWKNVRDKSFNPFQILHDYRSGGLPCQRRSEIRSWRRRCPNFFIPVRIRVRNLITNGWRWRYEAMDWSQIVSASEKFLTESKLLKLWKAKIPSLCVHTSRFVLSSSGSSIVNEEVRRMQNRSPSFPRIRLLAQRASEFWRL